MRKRLVNPFIVGDKVKLVENVVRRHIDGMRLPPSAGFSHETFEWHKTLKLLAGKTGVVERLFENSRHMNVEFDGLCIGIDFTELEPVGKDTPCESSCRPTG